MINLNKVFKIYLSHSLAGAKGKEATDGDIWENVYKYRKIGTEIKAYLIDWEKMDGFPKFYLYVPADHEEFVFNARKMKYINVPKILDIDCAIVRSCDLVIACGDHLQSKGMQVEIDHASKMGIPVYFMPVYSLETIRLLKHSIKLILKEN